MVVVVVGGHGVVSTNTCGFFDGRAAIIDCDDFIMQMDPFNSA